MGEKQNFVVAFPEASLRQADLVDLTSQLASRILSAEPRSWMAIRAADHVVGSWPLSADDLRHRISLGEIVAVYPREDGSSVDGAIVWSSGARVGTVTVAVPIGRVPESTWERLALVAMEIGRSSGARLCAVGSELELENDDEDELRVDVVATRAQVDLTAFASVTGEVSVIRRSCPA